MYLHFSIQSTTTTTIIIITITIINIIIIVVVVVVVFIGVNVIGNNHEARPYRLVAFGGQALISCKHHIGKSQ